jgi:hypothetical protein
MYQPQQNQAKISPGLSALMELQRTAAATTPDGTPTIAFQVAQKVQGMQGQGQEQPQAPQGIAGIAPNLPPQIQNALVGGQIQQQQQQQAQQAMMQMAQQQAAAQKPPGPLQLAQGGIAGLPADNMHNMGRYAHGGVIGFNGETSSKVPLPDLSEEDKTRMRQSLGDRDTAADFLADQQEKIAMGKTVTNVPTKVPDSLVDKIKQLFAAKETGSVSTGLTPTQQAAIEGAGQTLRQQVTTKPSVDYAAADAAIRARQGVNAAPAPVGIAKTLPTPVVQTQLKRPSAAAAPTPAQTVPGMEMPTMDSASAMDARTTLLAPNVDTSDYEAKVSAMGKLAKERQPSTAIADLTKAEEKRKALEDSRLGNYNINALMKFAIAAGRSYRPGAGGAAVAEFNEEQHKLAQMNQQAEAMFDASIRREKEAAFAIRMGDAKTATELAKQSVDMRQAAQDARAKVAGNVMTAATSAFHSNVQMYNQKLSNLSNENIAAANIKARASDALLSNSEATAKLKFIDAQAAQLAKEENSPTVLPRHTLAARTAWEAAGGQVQAALIGAKQREGAAAGAAEAKLAGVLATAQKDFLFTPEGMKASKAKTPEEKAAAATAWKNYVSKLSPAQLGEATKEQLVGAGGAGTAGVTRLQFDAAGKQI